MNSKHLLFSLTVALLSAGLFPSAAQAATITIDSLIYQTNGDGTASVTDCTDSSGSVEIPSSITVDGTPYTVTSIGNYAFTDCTKLTNITIPDSVTSIGNRAFVDCSSLTNIIIPDSVQTVSEGSFAGCNSLTQIFIPNSVSSIGEYAFLYCKSLNKVYFQSQKPPKMDDSTFSKCPSNMMIYYPAGAEPNWGPLWHEFSTAPWDPVK